MRIVGRDAEWHVLTGFAAGSGLGVVTGMRRQGKTFLLEALTRATGGLYLGAVPATEAESLRLIAEELAQHTGAPPPRPTGWEDAVRAVLDAGARTVVIDDVAHLVRICPTLPALLRRELDARPDGPALVLGGRPAAMAELAAGPLRGRVDLQLAIRPLGHRSAARLWDVDDPELAVRVHAVVGGTIAYRRLACGDVPADHEDFDAWVQRTVLEPTGPLFREADHLLASAEVRDPALYHSILAAVAASDGSRGAIADQVGRRAADIGHHLNVLEDCGLLQREPDVFRAGRTTYHVAEPLLAFHLVVVRSRRGLLECGRAPEVWKEAQQRFATHVLGPHFAQLCRAHAAHAHPGGRVGSGVVTDGRRTSIGIDVAVFAPTAPGEAPRILSLGIASWDERIGPGHAQQLRQARELLGARGYDVRETRLACYGGAGFTPDVTGAMLLDPADLYG